MAKAKEISKIETLTANVEDSIKLAKEEYQKSVQSVIFSYNGFGTDLIGNQKNKIKYNYGKAIFI